MEEKETSWWEKLNNWWNSNSNSNEDNSGSREDFSSSSSSSTDFSLEFPSNQSLTTEEKIRFYQAIGYKDQQGSKELIYPDEVSSSFSYGKEELAFFSTSI